MTHIASTALAKRANAVILELVSRLQEQNLNGSASLRDDLAIDSLTMMSIAFRLEEEFGFELVQHAERIATIATLDDLYLFLERVQCAR